MKKDHRGGQRGFFHVGQSIHADGRVWGNGEYDEIRVGFYHLGGGTTGEFTIIWMMLGGSPVPQIRVFDDAWSALVGFKDLLEKLAEHDGENLPPEAVKALLKECGVEDMTEYARER